jgi:NTP pyrophosphatase (non-canonical NTP hydrolase)
MTGNEYQELAMRTGGGDSTDDRMMNAVIGLAGEVGEVAEIVKKWWWHGHDLNRERLISELGDVLWYIALAAESQDISMDGIMKYNISKLKKRYPNGFDPERSKNRDEEEA